MNQRGYTCARWSFLLVNDQRDIIASGCTFKTLCPGSDQSAIATVTKEV